MEVYQLELVIVVLIVIGLVYTFALRQPLLTEFNTQDKKQDTWLRLLAWSVGIVFILVMLLITQLADNKPFYLKHSLAYGFIDSIQKGYALNELPQLTFQLYGSNISSEINFELSEDHNVIQGNGTMFDEIYNKRKIQFSVVRDSFPLMTNRYVGTIQISGDSGIQHLHNLTMVIDLQHKAHEIQIRPTLFINDGEYALKYFSLTDKEYVGIYTGYDTVVVRN